MFAGGDHWLLIVKTLDWLVMRMRNTLVVKWKYMMMKKRTRVRWLHDGWW